MGSICKPSVTNTTERVDLPDYLQNYEEQAVNRLLESSDIGRAIAGFSIDPNTGETTLIGEGTLSNVRGIELLD